MHFKQFYVGCLAHASYLIGDGREALTQIMEQLRTGKGMTAPAGGG